MVGVLQDALALTSKRATRVLGWKMLISLTIALEQHGNTSEARGVRRTRAGGGQTKTGEGVIHTGNQLLNPSAGAAAQMRPP